VEFLEQFANCELHNEASAPETWALFLITTRHTKCNENLSVHSETMGDYDDQPTFVTFAKA
jgi:hypothetical protein